MPEKQVWLDEVEEPGKDFYVFISKSTKIDMNILYSHCVLTQSLDNVKLTVPLLTTLENRSPTSFAKYEF